MSIEFLSESEKVALHVDMEDVISNDGEYPKETPRKTLALLYEARVLRRALRRSYETNDGVRECHIEVVMDECIAQAKAEIDAEAQWCTKT